VHVRNGVRAEVHTLEGVGRRLTQRLERVQVTQEVIP
jgi:hypothetical protein